MQQTDITKGEGGNTINALHGSKTEVGAVQRIFAVAASLDGFGMALLRLGLVIVLVWIGGLKFARYEAVDIVPLVANSPLMSFFCNHPAPEYRHHMNKEGGLNPANRQWSWNCDCLDRNTHRATTAFTALSRRR
jgi:hypothetical protein